MIARRSQPARPLPRFSRGSCSASPRARSTARRALAAALLFAFATAPLSPARADDPPKDAAPARADARPPAKLKVLKLDEFTVEGHIQKPQAFFILQRSNLSFEDPDKKESFLPKIVKTCEKDPF